MVEVVLACRFCQGPANATLQRQRLGRICRPCHRQRRRYASQNSTPAALARKRRYDLSPKRKTVNDRRLRVGDDYFGKAATIEEATRINAHLKERLSELKQGLAAGEETESVSTLPVRTQTEV